MDSSRIGLDFIVENPDYIRKLAAALDTQNTTVKKQVFELLSALCVHNEDGRARSLDTLEQFKKLKGERYRLTVIVDELDRATAVDYQTALVAFINCLIISTPRLNDRTRLRNEFIGCHLLPVLNNLRKCAEAEPELAVQLDVFDEQRESDDAQSLQGPHGVDLNSPLDVFYAILKQVADTPQEIPFLSILQHLLRIDPKEPVSDIIWDTAERLVHRATLLENREDASRLLRTPSTQSKIFCHCQHRIDSPGRKQSLSTPLSPTLSATLGPPPPPPTLGSSLPPPPPPPPVIPSPPCAPPPAPAPPPPQLKTKMPAASKTETDTVIEKLPQQEIPAPKTKMKTINWNKIPNNKVIGKNNIWTEVAYSHQHSPMADMDWSEMEGLFCQQAPPSAHSSPKLGHRDSSDNLERRMRKDTTEITLLDGKRSLNVNIFLKQFRSTNEDIIQLIRNGEHDEIGTEKLKGLLKILPEVDELDMLKSFHGDFNKLGNAEKFLIHLTNLPNYKLRIESMLLKEEFASNMGYLEPSINSMIVAAQDLMTNKPLKEVLYMILIAGNFLNAGGYAGDAAGVKLSSLQKITDIRANKPNMNLIHFVALQAEKKNKHLVSFTDNISVLEDAAKTTVEQLYNEINALDVRIKKIRKQIETPATEPEIKAQMTEFLQMAEIEVASLQKKLGKLDHVRRELSEFFCEDINSFKLEECFRIFHGFYCKFKQAVAENERRRIQEEQANERRRQREELLATKRKQMGTLADSDFSIDMQIYDTRSSFRMNKCRKNGSEDEISLSGSPSLSRRRLGSFNGNGNETIAGGKEEKSPDTTPNGSLRRRRSRVLSEDDEGNLMDFLRASGGNNNRERKSWGSLDRSWARKARGSGPRKRPALLSADFSADRERPSSPSPLTEQKTILSAPEEETKPKEWRQKIESWLQANENDQLTDEQRRTRRTTNRRSLEMDSESERSSTLDTLPEGKQVYTGGQSNYKKVNPAWQPSNTIDNTDVVSAMETVEEVQLQVKDKSAWRKSTLNVANSTEATKEDSFTGRHTLPRDKSLHSIDEDKALDRKGLISSLGERMPTDRLTLYIRKPATEQSFISPPVPRRNTDSQPQSSDGSSSNNKLEIDQDNIETPPATRRIFVPTPTDKREPLMPGPCSRKTGRSNNSMVSIGSPDEPEDGLVLGDGQFDRYSSARRTRRYKRNQENPEIVTTSPTETVVAETQIIKSPAEVEVCQPVAVHLESELDKESRLKVWQEKLKNQNEQETKNGRRWRNQTGIKPSDIEMALRLNNKNSNISYLAPETTKAISNKIDIPSRKTKEHDNDEGFEETQSLMSESPSQGASSGGCNYDTDMIDTTQIVVANFSKSQPIRQISVDSKTGDSSTSGEMTLANYSRPPVRTSRLQSLPNSRAPKNLVNQRKQSQDSTLNKKSIIPRRTDSIKNDVKSTNHSSKAYGIQKSSSRNSIVSSRSSLNSATSVSTVKKLPLKPNTSNNLSRSVQRTPSNKVIPTAPKVNLKRTSSNGTSIGNKPPRPQAMSFMKPTASSATKSNQAIPTNRFNSFRSKN